MKLLGKAHKKGFVAIETILALSVALMVILLTMGMFTLIYPRQMLQIEANNLAQEAKVQGGLTDPSSKPVNSDIALFDQRMQQLGYNPSQVKITAVTDPGNINVIGVPPIGANGTNYVHRDSGDLIVITVQVPANVSILAPMSFFHLGSSLISPDYTLSETVESERW